MPPGPPSISSPHNLHKGRPDEPLLRLAFDLGGQYTVIASERSDPGANILGQLVGLGRGVSPADDGLDDVVIERLGFTCATRPMDGSGVCSRLLA